MVWFREAKSHKALQVAMVTLVELTPVTGEGDPLWEFSEGLSSICNTL